MKLNFTKMHGCGNDYIYINCFDQTVERPESLAVALSDRHTGIGGDGIVLITPSGVADAGMRMFNLDGSEGRMCGNAIRCVAKYLRDSGMVAGDRLRVETLSGIKELEILRSGRETSLVRVDMGPAELSPPKIPVTLPGESIIDRPVEIGGKEYSVTCVSMGNPHAVIFCKSIDDLNLTQIGPVFENASIFPERINTEFIQVLGRNRLKMRVWERGSGETKACGTGACAAGVASVLLGHCDSNSDIVVSLLGGELIINYTGGRVYMTGNSTWVFDGTVELKHRTEKETLL